MNAIRTILYEVLETFVQSLNTNLLPFVQLLRKRILTHPKMHTALFNLGKVIE